jgi:MFS family permease
MTSKLLFVFRTSKVKETVMTQTAQHLLEEGAKRETKIVSIALKRIMPLVLLMMLMSYMDRVNLGVLGSLIQQDLGMTATGLGFAAGIFYVGYVFLEVPSNLALVKFGSRRWLARIMITWGVVTGLTYFVHVEWLFYVARFLLGAMEAGLSPGILFFLMAWFPKAARKKSWAVFQLSIPLGLMFGALATSALLGAATSFAGSDGWRWVFLIEGIATVAVGFFILKVLPEKPTNAAWLSQSDAQFLQDRLTAEKAEDDRLDPYAEIPESKRVLRALRSGVAWYFSAIYFLMILGFWTIPYWLPQTIASKFNTDPVQSGFISVLPWAVVFFAILLVNYSSRRTRDTQWHMVICLVIAAAGVWVASATDNGVLAIAALAFAGAGMQSAGSLFYHYQVGAFRGIMVAVVLAMVNSVGNIGGFFGPYLFGFLKDFFGNDVVGLRVLAVAFAIAAVLALFLERTLVDPRERRVSARTLGRSR